MSDSKKVFQLRKDKQLSDAYNLAIDLYHREPNDEWIQKSYAWVLIDIVKIELNNDINKASAFFNQLQSIDFVSYDEIITKQINYLRPKLDANYREIQKAEISSKNGNHLEALSIFKQLQKQGKLSENYHEPYGWAIYRYIKANANGLATKEIKKFLFIYLGLKNPRPELLHSVILQFSISYANKHHDFNLYKFFELWNPRLLRDEDKEKQYKEGKAYPSLVEKLIKEFINKQYPLNIEYLQNSINDSELVIETIREAYFWKIYNLHNDNMLQELWQLFDFYVSNFSNYGASHWHSKILKIADRFMKEDNSWRFFMFFQKWGIDNLNDEDWQEEINGDFKNKPIALKALKKIFDFSKLPNSQNNNFNWVLPLYKIALEKFKNDIWILREYATLLNITGDNLKAVEIYKNIILELSDQAYIWHEFAKLLIDSNIDVAISMLCKAITIQKNEDFLGDIHLLLAKLLFKNNKFEEAKNELNTYKEYREKKGWKISEEFILLNDKLKEVQSTTNNLNFYKENIELSEEYIYKDIPWIDLLLYDGFTDKNQKEKLLFNDLNNIDFMINKHKFQLLKKSKINEVYQFKLFFDKKNKRYMPLKVRKSLKSKDEFIEKASFDIAVVDHINKEKKLFHYIINSNSDGIIRFSQTTIRPNIGQFIKISYFKTFNKKQNRNKVNILNVEFSNESKSSLVKNITGNLLLKYKYNNRTYSYDDIIYEQLDIDIRKPSFGFIKDYYVSKKLLKKYQIEKDCMISAKVLFNGDKWSVYELEILD